MPPETETTESTVTTTVQPLPGGGAVETIERREEYPKQEITPLPDPVDLAPIHSQIQGLSEQVAALVARVDDLIAAHPPAAASPPEPIPPEEPPESEDVLELEDAEELPEPTAKETTIKPSDEVTKEKPSKKKHAGFFI